MTGPSASENMLFELTRFQIRGAALTPGQAERIDDAYVLAWELGIYPLFHEHIRLHRPFERQFDVPRERLLSLMQRLDELWLDDRVPDFYELESLAKDGGPFEWTRDGLISALRYAFLSGRFDARLYAAIRTPGRHPIEANSIDAPFDRASELTLP